MAARGPMKLRTRLVISFVYVLLAVVLALTIPLGVSLAERGRADLEAQTLQDAQTIAAYLDPVLMRDPARLGAVLAETTPPNVTRVVVVGADGTVLHDSTGNAVGQDFANGERPEIDAALRGEPNAQDRFSDTIDARLLVAAAPIIQGVPVGALRLTRDYAEVEAATRRTTIGLAVIGGTTVLAGVIIAFALAGSIAKPIQRLAGAAHRLGDGDLTTRAGDVGGAAEVQDLGRSFDAMATRLEATVRAQREFVANASHQLRTPLTGMKLRLEAAMAATDDPGLRQQLVAADAEVDRLAEIVERLLATARRIELGEADDVDLADAARRAVARWRDRASQHGADVTADGDGGIAAADPTDVDQILDILVDNAIAYAPGDRRDRDGVGRRRGVARGPRRGTRHPARRARARHRALLPRARGTLGRIGPGPGDRARAGREMVGDAGDPRRRTGRNGGPRPFPTGTRRAGDHRRRGAHTVTDAPTPVRLWIDPSCPWAWQAFTWLRDLRDQGVVSLTYAFFSLEINARALERNATDPGMPFGEAAPTYGDAFTALAWARRTGGQEAVERLLVAFGTRRHGAREEMSSDLLAAAVAAADVELPPAEEIADLEREILSEYAAARSIDVFGVPTLQVAEHSVIYGPVIAVGPTGEDGVALWREVAGVVERPGFFELKRWPRGQRPGGDPVRA